MANNAGITPRPQKREKRRPVGEDYTVINLAMLTRFEIFVEEVQRAEGPISFRSYMKNDGSHRTIPLTLDRIEELSEQLLIRREIMDEHGKRTGRYLTDYEGLKELSTRRPSGINPRDITPHGEVWAELSRLINDLFDMAIDKSANPRQVEKEFRNMRQRLSVIHDATR